MLKSMINPDLSGKKTSLVLVFMLIMLLAISTSLMAVDYYVDPSGTDDMPGGTSGDPWATIEYAVNSVSDPETETIVIHVSGDTYTLNSNDIGIHRHFGSTSGGLTIRGAGAGSTIVQAVASGTANDRVFHIYGTDETVTLEAMTIRYGETTESGGGIYVSNTTLTLTNCTVSGNNAGNDGGGIRITSGTITMTNCTVSGNTTTSYGGGISNSSGTLTSLAIKF